VQRSLQAIEEKHWLQREITVNLISLICRVIPQVCALALVPAHIKLLDHNVLAQPFEIDREHSSSNGRRYKYVETMP
jgi:hypothetical protein